MSFEYAESATAVAAVLAGRSGAKAAIYGLGSRNVRRVYALVHETLKRAPALARALAAAGVPAGAGAGDAGAGGDDAAALRLVLAHELLYGAGRIKGGGAAKREVLAAEPALRRALALPPRGAAGGGMAAAGGGAGGGGDGDDGAGAAGEGKPRWVRVNTLRASVRDVVAALTEGGGGGGGESGGPPRLPAADVSVHAVVPTVLRLPSDAHARLALHAHPLVTSGAIALQDLASAMPVAALLDGWGRAGAARAGGGAGGGGVEEPFDAVDCCAAPGNKTTQLAAALAERFGYAAGAAVRGGAGAGAGAVHVDAAEPARAPPAPAASSAPEPELKGRALHAAGGKRRRAEAAAAAEGVAAAAAVSAAAAEAPGRPPVARAPPRAPALSPPPPRFTVFAFDRDGSRLALLRERVGVAGAGSFVAPAEEDFLAVDTLAPAYARVRAVVLDPSCSGSGMPTAAGAMVAAERAAAAGGAPPGAPPSGGPPGAPPVPARLAGRVAALADFQTRALRHALTFPGLRRLVYSTCSVFAEEDEAVVAAALAAPAARPGRRVALARALPGWHRRGLPGHGLAPDDAARCVRCSPEDGTTGFFLAVLDVVDDEGAEGGGAGAGRAAGGGVEREGARGGVGEGAGTVGGPRKKRKKRAAEPSDR